MRSIYCVTSPSFLHRLSLVILLLFLVGAVSAQKDLNQLDKPTRLESGRTIRGEIFDAQPRSYLIALEADQYLQLVLVARGPDMIGELHAPGGTKSISVNTLDFPGQAAPVLCVANTPGDYRLDVRLNDQMKGVARYEIRVEEVRAAVAADRKRAEAEQYFTQAQIVIADKSAHDEAVSLYDRALRVYRDSLDRQGELASLIHLGNETSYLGQPDRALEYYRQALVSAREIKDRRGEGRVVTNMGLVNMGLGEREKAIGYFEQALTIAREIKDRQHETWALYTMAGAYDEAGQHEKAITGFEQALAIARETKDRQSEGQALSGLGWTSSGLSQYRKAIGYYDSAARIFRELKDLLREASVLNNTAVAYQNLSQYAQAISYQERALANYRVTNYRLGQGTSLSGLGWIYNSLGQYDVALEYLVEALAISREGKTRRDEAYALNNLGDTYDSLRQFEKSVVCQEQALVIFREIHDRQGETIILKDLGTVYRDMGRLDEAMKFHEQALAISREIKDRGGEGISLSNLADIYRRTRDYQRAIAYHQQSLSILHEVSNRQAEAQALVGLMDDWRESGSPRLAIFFGKQAANTLQAIRSDIRGLSREMQQSFLKDNEKPYHTLVELLISQGRLAEAEQVLHLLKEEEYFEFLRREANDAGSLTQRAELTPEEAAWEKRYLDIGERLIATGRERGELLAMSTLTPEETQRLTRIEQDLAAGNVAFDRFLSDLATHFSGQPEANARIEQLRETQGIMADLSELPTGTVAIYTIVGEDKYRAILVTPDAQKAYEYPINAVDLNRKVLEFRQVVRNPKLDPRPKAEELYRILLGNIAADLRQAKAQTLMWSLDGSLRYLPIAALFDGNQYLVETFRVSVFTPASNARLKDSPNAQWKAAGFGVTKAYAGSSALPSVGSELEGIISKKPGDGGVLQGEIRLDGQFTEEAMRTTLRKRYPVVHIASHFRFLPGNETNSFLLLGDGSHLSLAELKNLPNLFVGVELLTLSACNTGVGDTNGNGKEVEGFGVLAQRKGAKAVIASLWPVADVSTSLLMQELYRIRETSPGMTKSEALREAQLELLRGTTKTTQGASTNRLLVLDANNQKALIDGPKFPFDPQKPYSHPYFWAPFFLMGNWL